jgi:BCD family chlorophyll transporter-like MFS transporter
MGSGLCGLALSVLAYALIGAWRGGLGHLAAGAAWPRPPTPQRRAAAATITWLMMIFGIAVTATTVGKAAGPLFAPLSDEDRRGRGPGGRGC